ncbi:MAG: NfeD family protein [Bacteroidota bacterium]
MKKFVIIGFLLFLNSHQFIFPSAYEINQDSISESSEDKTDTSKTENFVYTFKIHQNIEPSALRLTKKAFKQAREKKADYIVVDLDTYGGLVNIADSIRSAFLGSEIPIMVFIKNNAASAGALISIAADSIYMKEGSSIGAASVVNQEGKVMPEKYQSYMRSTMRATAEAKGKKIIVDGKDTTEVWRRDPRIAEAMVDPRIAIEGITDSTEIITFTAQEAIKHGYCEAKAKNIKEVLQKANIKNAKIESYEVTTMDKIIGFLISPALQGILIMLIVGGIYFEMQSPGLGFPIVAAITAAALYFAPLYLEGIAQHWEILLFIAGLILIGIELFAIPGFGVAGVAGIILVVTGLVMSMVDNVVFEHELHTEEALKAVFKAFFIVTLSMFLGLVLSLYMGKKVLTSKRFSSLVLDSVQDKNEGYVSVDKKQKTLIGKTGVAYTVLRPGGKVNIEDEIYDAKSEIGFIDKGEKVKVISTSSSQLYVMKI